MKRVWQKIPYWLRGGVIGVLAAVLSLLAHEVCGSLFLVPSESLGFECLFTVGILWVPLMLLPESFDAFYELAGSIFSFATIFMWFIIGSLIGAIISYIKKRTR